MTGCMDTDLRTLLAFSMIRNINLSLAEQILARIRTEEAFFTMSHDELVTVGRLSNSLTEDSYRQDLKRRAKEEERFIISNKIKPLYFLDTDYPSRLMNCTDAPVMLYQIGETNLDSAHMVSIVGTRNATPQGLEITNRIVRELSERLENLVIVSGLAYGIDVAAHKAALEYGVPTVGVTAHPLNTIYPAEHRNIAVRMVKEGGSLVTEYCTSHEVHRANFLARNRIIAGLSDVTIIVESGAKGGSLVTAALAGEYNREVFAVPGRLTDKYSSGTLDLIVKDRAHLYLSADELIEEMGWTPKTAPGQQMTIELELNEEEQQIYSFLQGNPGSKVNEIMLATNIPHGRLKDLLFNLEMQDLVMSIAGGRYSAL